MADLVREIFSRGDLSQEAAHWMAILAMEQYAYFLADGTGIRLTCEIRRPQGNPKRGDSLALPGSCKKTTLAWIG